MRKDLGYEFCRTESEKNPYVAGPLKRTDCSLVSDGAAALVLAGRGRRRGRWPAGGGDPRGCPRAGLPADRRGATSSASRAARRRGRGRYDQAGLTGSADLDLRRDARLLHHRRADRVRGDGPRRSRPGRGLDAVREGWTARWTAGCRSIRSGGPEGEGPPDRRDRRVDARALRHAAQRAGGRRCR
jgi:acetyl-CoA C-acetyltransferase